MSKKIKFGNIRQILNGEKSHFDSIYGRYGQKRHDVIYGQNGTCKCQSYMVKIAYYDIMWG